MSDSSQSVLALDYGEARIGLALASKIARLPHPLVTLTNDEQFLTKLKDIITAESVDSLVVGYPRGMDGQITDQTKAVDVFIDKLKVLGLPLFRQDETLTSVKAEAELNTCSNKHSKEAIDALAAAYILEDWLISYKQ